MKPGSTLVLRGIVILIGLAVLVLCVFALPASLRSENAGGYRPILWDMYVTTIPFFIGGYHTLRLLASIDHNQAFSPASVKTLKLIKHCALTISALYAIGLPYIVMVAEHDDAPGVILIGLVFTFAPLVAAVFAAILQQLFQDAIAIKSENDLTV